MATKTKRIREASVRPPLEIREDTKARRAWLAAKVEEINTAGGFEAKVVGQGFYQEVRVVRLVEVEGRERLRGTCQACGGKQVVEDGMIVLHGYRRPGDGYTYGRCMGVRHEPAEKDTGLTTALIGLLDRSVETLKAKIEALGFTVHAHGWLEGGTMRRHEFTLTAEEKAAQESAREMAHRRIAERDQAAHLTANVLPMFGQEIATEVVA